MGVRVAGDRELGPTLGRVLAPGAGDEVTGGVAAVQAGGVNGDGRLLGDQAACECGRNGAVKEVKEVPPFKSRVWA